jgi:putative sterol carrier protein
VLRRAGAADDIERDRRPGIDPGSDGARRRYAPPVAEFLSEAWIAELDDAARAAPALAAVGAERPLVVEQRVRHGDDEVVYSLCFDASGARVVPGPATSPDVVILTDDATARALQHGTINAQQAAVTGRLKLRGDVEHLRSAGDALRAVGDVFREVRATTTRADEDDPDAPRRR